MHLNSVAVIGGGAWGTALAQAAAMAGRPTTLVVRTAEQAAEINLGRTNEAALPGQVLLDGPQGPKLRDLRHLRHRAPHLLRQEQRHFMPGQGIAQQVDAVVGVQVEVGDQGNSHGLTAPPG